MCLKGDASLLFYQFYGDIVIKDSIFMNVVCHNLIEGGEGNNGLTFNQEIATKF